MNSNLETYESPETLPFIQDGLSHLVERPITDIATEFKTPVGIINKKRKKLTTQLFNDHITHPVINFA